MGVSREPYQQLLFAITELHSECIDSDLLECELGQVNDWNQFLGELELDGLAPIFYRHCRELEITLPPTVLTTLKSLVIRHKAIANARYKALREFDAALCEANIPWLALKGLSLATTLYQDDSLRPMRDFDVLVPQYRIQEVALILRKLNYSLPVSQPSQYMRYTHQLPNAEKNVNGFQVSIEVHHNALGQDANDSIVFEDVREPNVFTWRDVEIHSLSHTMQLHQLARHLEALHPGGRLKLINVMDVAAYAEEYFDQIDWQLVKKKYPHIITTLECLRLISPMGRNVNSILKKDTATNVSGIGEIMLPLSMIFSPSNSLKTKLNQLLKPSDWWLHLFYGVSPQDSLLFAKWFKQPATLCKWAFLRIVSSIRGG